MPDPSELIAALFAVAGTVIAAWAATTRPMVAIGALFLLASLSRLVIETPGGTMRLEQPAIAVVAIVLLIRGRLGVLRSVSRTELVIAGAFAGYLAVLAVSSAIRAPQPVQSLRLVAWLAISMVGGGVVYVLARSKPPIAIPPFAFAGAANGAVGIVVAALFLVLGTEAERRASFPASKPSAGKRTSTRASSPSSSRSQSSWHVDRGDWSDPRCSH